MLSHLGGGLTNHSWQVQLTNPDERWVLRQLNPQADELGIDRSREQKILQQVSAAGLSPEILELAPDCGFTLCRYISGSLWDTTSLKNRAAYWRLLDRFAELHNLPLEVSRIDMLQQADGYLAQLPAHLPHYQKFSDGMQRVCRQLQDIPMVCLCHNDLNPGNLLDDGQQVWMIDWEYSGGGDPLFDLATVLRTHHADDALAMQLLADWLDLVPYPLPLQSAWRRLQNQLLLVDWLGWLWSHVRLQQNSGAGSWPQRSEFYLLKAFAG